MQKTLALSAAAFAALALLSACNKQADTAATENTSAVENTAAAAPVAPLPPSIVKSAAYRCDNGHTPRADFSSDGSAMLTIDGGKTIRLTGGTAGQDSSYTGEGYTLKTTGTKASYTIPGKSAVDCES